MSFLGIAGGLLGGVLKAGTGVAQMIQAGKIHPQYSPYTTSQYAQNRLGVANQLYNGRMAGAANLERNINTSGSNAISNINRNATDSGQALALAAGVQGQTNDQFDKLQTKEAQNQYNLLDNLNQGYDAMTKEGDKSYNDKMQKYQMDMGRKSALQGAGMSNITGAVNDAAGMFTQMGQQQQQADFNKQYLGLLGGLRY